MCLADLISTHRHELLQRCALTAQTLSPGLDASHTRGIGAFLDQLIEALHQKASRPDNRIRCVAHDGDFFSEGATLTDVVRDYENVCQAVSELAVEHGVAIAAADHQTTVRCLDDTVSAALASYAARLRKANRGRAENILPLVDGVIAAFDVLQGGRISIGGSTGDLVRLSLQCIRTELEAFPDHGASPSHAEPAMVVQPAIARKVKSAGVTASGSRTQPGVHGGAPSLRGLP
jgi:hypothetical protein